MDQRRWTLRSNARESVRSIATLISICLAAASLFSCEKYRKASSKKFICRELFLCIGRKFLDVGSALSTRMEGEITIPLPILKVNPCTATMDTSRRSRELREYLLLKAILTQMEASRSCSGLVSRSGNWNCLACDFRKGLHTTRWGYIVTFSVDVSALSKHFSMLWLGLNRRVSDNDRPGCVDNPRVGAPCRILRVLVVKTLIFSNIFRYQISGYCNILYC